MQTGSQVSLAYDIDLSLTRIPENLIFYSDSARTNAMYKENGVIHFDGYFSQDTVNKTDSKTIYWEWPMETGSTQAEIDANDELDTEWIGDEIALGIEARGRQVTEENGTQYTVTFDANGGTLQGYGNASQTSKMVTYGELYGNLPTPTRAGYRFVGWNGKNKFDEYSIFMAINGAVYENGKYVFHPGSAYSLYGHDKGYPIDFKSGTAYTLSVKGYVEEMKEFHFQFNCVGGNNKSIIINSNEEVYSVSTASNSVIEMLIARFNNLRL